MSIINKKQISIHLSSFKNLSTYTTGRYSFRISFHAKIKNTLHYAVPINIIEKRPTSNQGDNQSLTEENYYMTRSFILKGGANCDIDQICIFRFDIQIGLQQTDCTQIQPFITIELIHQDFSQMRIVSEFRGKFKQIVSDSLIVDFYDSCPGQLVGSIHSCILSYEYLHKKIQNNTREEVNQILNYLKDVSEKNLEKIQQNLLFLKGSRQSIQTENPLANQMEDQDAKVNKQNATQQIPDLKTESTEEDCQKIKRKRKPIFENSLPLQKKPIGLKKSSDTNKVQNTLHQNSMKIYEIWRQLNQTLMTQKGDKFIFQKEKQFYLKLKNKVGQSVIRFKGSKDIDQYSDYQEIQRRNMMVSQLRNQPQELFNINNQFSIINLKDFTRERPIFFSETAQCSKQSQQYQENYDFMLIFLVHGLGACRLDMERLKVELKRYYIKRVKIYVSTANEARTQGDIDGMGFRLANQVESEISKTKGNFKVSMMGHSMGGLIIRSALPRLEKFKDRFHSLVTFSSPHIGYAYSTSKLVDAGLWILNTMKKCTSIQQMTMTDNPKIQQCFLYKLSQKQGLQWFKKITLLGSHQDLYVPFYSARIQKSKQIQTDFEKGFKRGIYYCKMIDNILKQINGKLTRLDVNFCIQQQNIDNLIGRAAHISFINNVQMLRTFCIAEEHSIF